MVSKEAEEAEIECPVCDKKVPWDAKICPGCGADFSISGMEDLEAVATELVEAKPPPAVEVIVQEEPPRAEAKPPETSPKEEEKKGGLFKRLFGKK